MFGAVTPEKRLLICENMQKLAYLADYLRTCSIDPDQLFSIDRHMGGDN